MVTIGRYVNCKNKIKMDKIMAIDTENIIICNKQSTQYFNNTNLTQKVAQKKFKYNIIF